MNPTVGVAVRAQNCSTYAFGVSTPARGLDPGARYRDVDTGAEYGGAFLTHRGLTLRLAGDYASALVVLRRVSSTQHSESDLIKP